MRIQFEIKENLQEIKDEILHSSKWLSSIMEEDHGMTLVTIADYTYGSEAEVRIWSEEIHITTAWSNFNDRIFQRGGAVWCEYVGAYRGLLEQDLLPTLTPKENILESKVLNSSLLGGKTATLRDYGAKNLRLKQFRRDNYTSEFELMSPNDHPGVVYDEYVKEGLPVPPPSKA